MTETKATTATTLDPGSYSHGTLRDEDMCEMFETIGSITGCDWCEGETSNLRDLLDDSNLRGLFVGADISESISYLFDHVEEHHTPDGYYFGATEGDGSDFGVWFDYDNQDGWVCVDCVMLLANADTPEHMNEEETAEYLARVEQHGEGAEYILNCPEECEGGFSWSPCDLCDSTLGGDRHPVSITTTSTS